MCKFNSSIQSQQGFDFIDVAFGSTANRNNIIRVSELTEYAKNKSLVDCYSTYYRYPQAMRLHFDNYGSVKGYTGSLYAEFLPLDIDSIDLSKSLEWTKGTLLYIQETFDVDLKVIRIYFSGSKGFHLELPSSLFGFMPSTSLHEIFKHIAFKLLPEGITIDSAIYDKVRLWRLPNTVNKKSGLYKIPLSVDELFNLTIAEIKDLAKTPRHGVVFDDNATLNPSLNQLYIDAKAEAIKQQPKNKAGSTTKAYEKFFSQKVIKETEGRNKSLFSYGCKLRAMGMPLDEIAMNLSGINATRFEPPLDPTEFQNVLDSVGRYENESKKTFEFKTISWDELVGTQEPEIDFLIQDLLPAGNLILLAGKPKIGKSLLSLLLSLGVGLGDPSIVWDRSVKKGPVLFASTEDGVVRIKKRIWRMLGNPKDYKPDFHFYCGDCVLTRKDVFEAFKARVLELKPSLIVLDPLINLFRGRELNSAENMNEVLRPLQDLAKETGACVLVIHHARKSSGEDAIDIVQGSITISGVADGLLLLRSLRSCEDAKLATLEVILKDAEVPKKVVLRLDDRLRWGVEGDFEVVSQQNLETQVLKTLETEQDGLTIGTLTQILNTDYQQLYRLLCRLEAEGKVETQKTGRSHARVYFLKGTCKAKGVMSEMMSEMMSEKQTVTNSKHTQKPEGNSSLIKNSTLMSDRKNDERRIATPKNGGNGHAFESCDDFIHPSNCDCSGCLILKRRQKRLNRLDDFE